MSNGLDPELYFADVFWNPEEYLEFRDRIWEQQYEGRVNVGEVEQLPDLPAALTVPQPAD